MASKQDREALEDLEAMLDRGLKIEASPPRWQSTFPPPQPGQFQPDNLSPARSPPQSALRGMPPHGGSVPTYSVGAGTPATSPYRQAPVAHPARPAAAGVGPSSPPGRVYPHRVPVNSTSPQALYQRTAPKETQAVPSPIAARGMRASSSQASIAAALDPWEQSQREAAARAEAQRQQHVQRMQQLEQQRIELQRQERLELLAEQQEIQERELMMLRQRQQQQQQQQQQIQQQQMRHQPTQPHQQQQHQQHQYRLQEEAMIRQAQEQSLREAQIRDLQIRQAQALEAQAREESLREAQLRDARILEAQQREAQIRNAQIHEAQAREQEALAREAQEAYARDASEAREADLREMHAREDEAREKRMRELKEREVQAEREGAATMVQRTQDANGNVTTRVVKKGVEDFDFEDELGAGSYSTVVAAQDKQTLRKYAIKVLDKGHIIKEQKVKYVEIEKNTLNRLGDHPGVIKLYFTFQDRQSLYFVLDFAPNGELLHLIKRIGSLNEESARYYACQLLDAIEYMHEKGVIHRDLKPENILLDYKMRIKITDFGTAKILPQNEETGQYPADCRANSFVGTAEYVTPELLVDKTQGKSADIWAWGCVLYQMIAASPPFQGNTQYLTFQKIARLQYSIPPGFPYVVRDLLKHVLVKAPQRWTIDEIKCHEFFEGQDWSRKALWNTPPPRLQPYKATVASMKPRALGGRPPQRPMKLRPTVTTAGPSSQGSNGGNSGSGSSQNNTVTASSSTTTVGSQKSRQQVFVPTAAGLQPLNPSTLYGMPLNVGSNKDSSSSSTSLGGSEQGTTSVEARKLNASRAKRPPTQSASAASSALYKAPQSTSAAYQQSQERISALKRRMQEQRKNGRSTGSAGTNSVSTQSSNGSGDRSAGAPFSSSRPSASNSTIISPVMRSSSPAGLHTPTTPASPSPPSSPVNSPSSATFLPLPPLTQVESQWSQILVSAQERILQMGHMRVFASTHAPPQAPRPASKTSKESSSGAGDRTVALEDDSVFTKFFHSKHKPKLVIVTTQGRLLVLNDDRRIQYEVPVGVPQIDIHEVPFQTSTGRVNRIVVQMHSKVLTLDDPGKISSWMNTIDLSRKYYAQLTADQERNAFNAAAAAASAVSTRKRYVS